MMRMSTLTLKELTGGLVGSGSCVLFEHLQKIQFTAEIANDCVCLRGLVQETEGLKRHLQMSQDLLETAEREHEQSRATHESLLRQAEERLEREQQCCYALEARHNEEIHQLSEQLKQAQV